MPDITMCANKKCPIRDACYRYRAMPDRYQAYAMFEPKLTPTMDRTLDWDCDSFWECRDRGYKLRDTKEVDKQKSVFDTSNH